MNIGNSVCGYIDRSVDAKLGRGNKVRIDIHINYKAISGNGEGVR